MVDDVIPIGDQIRCVGRELGLRRNLYPGFVRKGKLTQEEADWEIKRMEAVYATLKRVRAQEEPGR